MKTKEKVKLLNKVLTALLLVYTGFYGQSLFGQTITKNFPGETLVARLNRIAEGSNIPVLYDTNLAQGINVPALNGEGRGWDDILALSLSSTSLTYKKSSDGSYAIVKKEAGGSAGKGKGTIKGRIVETETSEPLPFASVLVEGTQIAANSDESGHYALPNIPEGNYVLVVSYVGYKTNSVPVEVEAGKTKDYDVVMTGDNQMLQEVVLNSFARIKGAVPHTTEKALVTEIKEAKSLVSGISSEQISRSADRNAAEVVQRISGVTTVDDKFIIVRGLNQRYNMTYLNDNVAPSTETNSRAFALDLIPSRIIDKIMVYKTASPENQGDATGGTIKIYTKDAKGVKHFDLELQMGYRENTTFNKNFLTYNGGKTDFLGFDDGTRKLPSAVPGYGSLKQATLRPSEYAKAFNPTLTHAEKTALPNIQLTTNYYNAFMLGSKVFSTLTSFGYKNESLKTELYRQQGMDFTGYGTTDRKGNEDRNVSTGQLNLLQNFTLTLRDSSTVSFKNFILQQGQDATIERVTQPSFTDIVTYEKDITLSYSQRFLYAGNLGGNHYFDHGKHQFQWNGGYTYSQQETPDQRVIRLRSLDQGIGVGDTGLQWWARGYDPTDTDDADTTPLDLGIISRLWSKNSEGVYNGSLDHTWKITNEIAVKAGTFHQWKKRQLDRRVYTVHEGNVNPDIASPINPNNGNYVDHNLVRFREHDLQNVWSETYLNDGLTGLQVFDRTSGSDTYTGTEQNNSGYAVLNFTPANRFLEIYGGVRYEYNRQKIAAAIPPGDNDGINAPILVDNPTHSWLPSVNISVRPSESWVFRAAYGKTVNRTEFREVSPFRELDFENNQVLYGNPNLISAKVDNYDVRVEFYPNKNAKGEIISIGAFYKDLKNPIERINTTNRVISLFPQITYQNAASATIKGLEFEVRKSFDFIPGEFFRNLSFIGNVSVIESVTKNVDTGFDENFTVKDRPLQGQVPYIINTGLYYENPGLGSRASVMYNTTGESIYAAGRGYQFNDFIQGPTYRGSLIELPRHLIDFAYTQRIVKSLQLKFSVQNLLNQEVKIAEDYNFTNKYEKQQIVPATDATSHPTSKGDNIFSRFKPGRHFILSISYSL
ncbi:TonB-dependent receptor [uncultured Flavobacterium sp.]|uniref:TonB-dependent receptor n=1 Tax=uncultured Flavobacterium sp. TaxID=165435 RepID=UPI0025F0C4BB|nr:TonB-dependent receptor [uncultured Flavobacterium sp.]